MNIARMQQTSRMIARLLEDAADDQIIVLKRQLQVIDEVTNELWVELNKERAKCARLNHLMDNMHELFGPEEDASESPSNLESTQGMEDDSDKAQADMTTQECAQGVEPSNGPGVFPRSSEGLTGSARFARDGKEAQ